MRSLIYFLLVILAYFGSFYGATIFVYPLIQLKSLLPSAVYFVLSLFLVQLPLWFVQVLIGYRLLCSVKARNFAPPAQFTGFVASLGWLAVLAPVLVLVGYGLLIATGSAKGLSGIPLGLALAGAALVSVIPVVVCEAKSFYSLLPARA
jgi:hypothetical protein